MLNSSFTDFLFFIYSISCIFQTILTKDGIFNEKMHSSLAFHSRIYPSIEIVKVVMISILILIAKAIDLSWAFISPIYWYVFFILLFWLSWIMFNGIFSFVIICVSLNIGFKPMSFSEILNPNSSYILDSGNWIMKPESSNSNKYLS